LLRGPGCSQAAGPFFACDDALGGPAERLLTRDEARRIAANIAKLLELLRHYG
jgi:hypothetical protein